MAVTKTKYQIQSRLTKHSFDGTEVEEESGADEPIFRPSQAIGDPENRDNRAAVKDHVGNKDDYGLTVRLAGDPLAKTNELLSKLLKETTTLNLRFEEAFQTGITNKDVKYED